MQNCYPIFDFQEYPFYKIKTSDRELDLYLFGSQHNKKIQSIHPFIADILTNSDELTTEVTYAYDDFNIECLLECMVNDCDLSDILVAYFNSCAKIDNKIKKRKFYELSSTYMLGEQFVKDLMCTTYFKNNASNLTSNNISFTTACPPVSLFTSLLSNGIDNTLLLMYRKDKKQCYDLDNTNQSSYWFVRITMMITSSILYYFFMAGIFMSGKHFNDVFDDIKKGFQKIKIQKYDKNSINDLHLIQKRNNIWIPKIINTLNTSVVKSHAIVVGMAHIDDLIDKLQKSDIDIIIKKYSYSKHKFE
jgi:hypothetical protein